MDISAVNSTVNVYDINSISSTGQTDSSATLNAPASTSEVSGPGKWMSELQDLQKSDPDKFKQVTSEISEKLKQEAAGASGQQATFLNKLADKFGQASQSGDMSALQPPGGVSGHHGRHHHRVQQYASQQQQGAGADPNGAQQHFADLKQIIDSTLQDAGIST